MGKLRIAQSEVRLVEPEYTTDRPDLQSLRALIYEPLLKWNDGDVSPGLLQSWRISDGGRSWHLRIREGTRFHDGSPCVAGDVMTAVERLAAADGAFGMGGVYKPYLDRLQLEPRGEHELLVRSESATGDLVDILTGVFVGKQVGDGSFPLGTGPYRLDDYDEGESATLSWARTGSSEPLYRELSFVEIRDAENRYEALENGDMDLARSLELMEEIPTNENLCWRRSVNTLSVTCFLNGFDAPFSQVSARLAINLAVDVKSIIHHVWHGLGKEAATVVSPYHFGYPSDLEPLGYDPRRAQELLAESSIPDSLRLRTPKVTPDRAVQVSHLVQEQLSRIGVSVEVEVEDDRPKYARDVSQKLIGDMAMFDSSPLSTYRVLREKVSSEYRGLWWQGVAEEEADQLIETAHQAIYEEERRTAYEGCLRWLHRNPPWLYLYHPVRLYAHRWQKPGARVDHAGLLRLADVT
jgi:peptide/nickel transport system substrate-binding protein